MRSNKRGYCDARFSIAAMVLATGFGSFAILGTARSALADDVTPVQQNVTDDEGPTLDVELSDTSLAATISMIQKQFKNVNFVFQGDRANYRTVTLTAHGRPIGDVLNLIAASAGADIWSEDGIYHVAPEGTHVPTGPFKLGNIRLNFANAETVKETLTGEGRAKIDIKLPLKLIDVSLLGDIGRQMAPGRLSPGTSANRLLPGRPGGGGERQPEIEYPRSIKVEPIEAKDIIALGQSSAIVVRYRDDADGEAAFREIVQKVRLLDVKPGTIQIRAQFVSVSESDADRLGINWQFQKVNLHGAVDWNFPASDQAFVEFASGNMQPVLTLALTTGKGRLVASPLLTTPHNMPAEFKSAANLYSFIPEASADNAGASQTTYRPVLTQEISSLIVTPRINSDGTITLSTCMQLWQTHSDHANERVLVEQNTPVSSTLRAGESMVLGRLIRKQDARSLGKSLLPGGLPLNSKPHKSNGTGANNKELLIFITATIIAEPKLDTPKPDSPKPR